MNDINVKDIEKLDCEARYEIFLSMVAEERDIWLLINDDTSNKTAAASGP